MHFEEPEEEKPQHYGGRASADKLKRFSLQM
jgi:hypothetical protein